MSTMSQDGLSSLAILHVERDQSSLLWEDMDNVVTLLANKNRNSKIPYSVFFSGGQNFRGFRG